MEFLPLEKDGKKVYAGFGSRFLAAIVDVVVLLPIMLLFNYLTGFSIEMAMASLAILSFMYPAYNIYFHNRYGATPGKMVTGIRVTLPNGGRITLKEAFLRSSVDVFYIVFAITASIVALSRVDPELYMSAGGYVERMQLLQTLQPAWSQLTELSNQIWIWSEFIVLLLNKRRRAIHDFIAGTVVVHKEHSQY